MAGKNTLNGFRHRDSCARLYVQTASSTREAKRRCIKIFRLIAKLHGHGLIAKVKDSRLYRLTQLGSRMLSAVLGFYQTDFPTTFRNAV